MRYMNIFVWQTKEHIHLHQPSRMYRMYRAKLSSSIISWSVSIVVVNLFGEVDDIEQILIQQYLVSIIIALMMHDLMY